MTNQPDSKAVALSQKFYARLLVVYPRKHRREYGPAMAQLFRDQCRDAWAESRGRGLAALWFRVAIDTIKSAPSEHLQNLAQRKSAFNRLLLTLRMKSNPIIVFVALFTIVLVLAVGSSGWVASVLPDTYASTARIKSDGTNALMELKSDAILDRALSNLGLNEKWRLKYHLGNAFKAPETRNLLRKMIHLNPIPDTKLIDIKVYDDDRNEAAEIANGVATAYLRSRFADEIAALEEAIETVEKTVPDARRVQRENELAQAAARSESRVEIIDSAEPALRAIWPNKPLIVFLGILAGILVGALAGAIGAYVSRVLRRRSKVEIAPSRP